MIGDKITASAGKVFRRKRDGMLFGSEIYLGMAYPEDGEPYEELPEQFEEVDEPVTEETVIIDEETPLAEPTNEETAEEPEMKELKKVTLADYMALEEKVEQLINLLKNGRTE